MDKKKAEIQIDISPELEQVIKDGQRLITYIARDGGSELEPEITAVIIDSKYKAARNEWTEEVENRFMLNYDKLAKIVYPVTVESINAIIPAQSHKKRLATKAELAVAWYRRYTMIALLLLLISQIYWLFGHDLLSNLKQTIEQKENMQLSLIDAGTNEQEKQKLIAQLGIQNQKLDANYKLLLLWNKISYFDAQLSDELSKEFQVEYELKKKALPPASVNHEQRLAELELDYNQHKIKILQFENILSAGFILQSLQEYLLPLLYGLLGAFIFVLRSLLREIKSLTYTFDSEIRYRLRLTLGALGGMIIGWFLKPEESDALASLSPMAMAFLMGYNVDLLFSLMDRVIDNIRQAIEQKDTVKQEAKDAGTKSKTIS